MTRREIETIGKAIKGLDKSQNTRVAVAVEIGHAILAARTPEAWQKWYKTCGIEPREEGI